MSDPVNHPQHYASGSIECIEAIEASMSPEAFKGALKANIIKYVWRYEQKGGAESLKKAQWYLARLISFVDSEEASRAGLYEAVKEAMETEANYDPDDYMVSGCPDGFCPMPNVRQGTPEPLPPFPSFPPVS
jgi:hypothetical protein